MSDFFDLFQRNFLLQNALWGSVAVGVFCPLVGVYFFVRRMVLLGVALPQTSAAGISAGALLLQAAGVSAALHPEGPHGHLAAVAGSMVFTLGTLMGLAALERRGVGTAESRIGAVFAIAYALSILLVSANPLGKIEMLNLLHGEIVAVSARDLRLMLIAFFTLAAVLALFHRQFLLVSFDRETARVMGRNVLAWDSLLYGVIGLSLTVSVLMVGPMMTFAFLIIPPLAARRFCRRMGAFFLLSSAMGAFSAFIGFYASYHWDWPLGPTNILAAAGMLFGAVAAKALTRLR